MISCSFSRPCLFDKKCLYNDILNNKLKLHRVYYLSSLMFLGIGVNQRDHFVITPLTFAF